MEEHDASGDIFRCKLGNLPPDSDAKLQFSFVTELAQETDGSLKFVLPTVLNPRYNPSKEDGGTDEDTSFGNMNPCLYTLDFNGTVTSIQDIARVWSDSDKLLTSLTKGAVNIMKIGLADTFRLNHNLSFYVLYEEANKPKPTLEKGNKEKPGTLMDLDLLMLSFYPDLTVTAKHTVKAEFIFIIDRSGSMMGTPIKSAQESMLYFLKSLPVDCYFNVISFGSSYGALFPKGSERYSKESLTKAMVLQASLEANMGGTEILRPLEFVFRKNAPHGYCRQIFLLTDGDVSNVDEVISLVKRNSFDSRVFTVGIGDGVSTSLVRNVAKAGGGEVEFVTGTDKLQEKVMKLLKYALQPAVTDLDLVIDLPAGLEVAFRIPYTISTIFSGQRRTMYTFLKGQAESGPTIGQAKLSGKMGGQSFTHTVTFDVNRDAVITSGKFLYRMATKCFIKELEMAEKATNATKKREIIVASTAGNIISKYTAFVGVDKEKNEKIGPSLISHHMAPQMPRIPAAHRTSSLFQCSAARRSVPGDDDDDDDDEYYDDLDDFEEKACLKSNEKIRNHPQAPPNRSGAPPPPPPPPHALPPARSLRAPQPPLPPPPPPPEQQSSCRSDNGDILGLIGLHLPPPPAPPLSSSQGFSSSTTGSSLVKLQEFDGSWSLTEDLAAVLHISMETIQKDSRQKKDNVWITALAICWFTLKCPDERSVWEMVVDKARDWLVGQLGGQEEVDKLLMEVQQAVFPDSIKDTIK
ncbi:von Willebrand factor A domain-containing protein 5A-like isoform X2 [Haliotis rufescens]|nr:von Willebrand factor A domain-containing protein 5A-like isoform X2 [Haliotis rufescens]